MNGKSSVQSSGNPLTGSSGYRTLHHSSADRTEAARRRRPQGRTAPQGPQAPTSRGSRVDQSHRPRRVRSPKHPAVRRPGSDCNEEAFRARHERAAPQPAVDLQVRGARGRHPAHGDRGAGQVQEEQRRDGPQLAPGHPLARQAAELRAPLRGRPLERAGRHDPRGTRGADDRRARAGARQERQPHPERRRRAEGARAAHDLHHQGHQRTRQVRWASPARTSRPTAWMRTGCTRGTARCRSRTT